MSKIDELAKLYGRHLLTLPPWQQNVSGAQRVVMVVYDKGLERTLRAKKGDFEIETRKAGYTWLEADLADVFAQWMAAEEYREQYFFAPERMQLSLETEFPAFVVDQLRELLKTQVEERSILAVFGIGALFGFTRFSELLKIIEPDIRRGRLAIFFPGQVDRNNYRLLDARDGWNYLAVPITLYGEGGNT
jgi:hypothetical protein